MRKTYPLSDDSSIHPYPSSDGSVKDVTYCKNLLKTANGDLHTAEAVYGRSLTLYLK